jgi:uncharacterized protein (TIGR03435 family)
MTRETTRALAGVILIACMSLGAFAQSAPAPLEFEVISIKPAPPPADNRLHIRMSSDPVRVNYLNVSLKDVIEQAYRVQDYQISGPDWLSSERFDIAAKIPDGAPKDRIPEMFQALLADRFKLQLHRDTKELPMYDLVVAKNGPKLQKAESATGVTSDGVNGRIHVSAQVSMASFADYLSVRLGRPVRDKTELDGAYSITLDWALDAVDRNQGVPADGPSIFTAVQEQLGLKLEGRKGPVEILVIDHAEKVPTGN